MASSRTFAAVLRQHRLAAGHSQESLAELAGLSRRGISDIERGLKQTPHRDTVERLADALALDAPQRAAFLAASRGQGTALEARPARHPPRALIPLVGRHDELALFDACLSRAAPPMLFLAGEPGIGKSRLLAEAARLAEEQGWQVIAGGCVRQQGQEPYEPLVSALARHIGQMPPARQRVLLQGCAWLVRLLPELAERHVVPAPSWALPPPQERRLMFQAVARYLANVAGPAGTLLVLDDLQWASADALELLASLVHTANERPLRLIGAYRSTEVQGSHPLAVALTDMARESLAAVAPLGPLAADDAMALLERLWTDGAEASDALRQRVLRRAGGVPFFLVSCARAMRVSGPPEAAPRDRASAEGGAETIPWDVAQTVRQRVAALPAPARELLAVAAVAGRVLPAAVLLAVTGNLGQSHWQTLDAVEACGHAGLLLEHDVARYRFAHDLIREVVEGGLSAVRRAALHGEVAAALERLPGAPPVEELAYHYARAGQMERAVVYLEQAGDRARTLYAHAEAAAHYQEMARCLDELGRTLDAARARAKLGDALILLGRYGDARRALEVAASAYRAADDVEGAASTLGLIAHTHARDGTARDWLALADPLREVERLVAAGCTRRVMARLYFQLANALSDAGQPTEQLDFSLRAIELARDVADETSLVAAMQTQGYALEALGRWNDAIVVLEETVVLAERIGELGVLPRASMHLGQMFSVRGDFVTACMWHERAVAAATQFGDPPLLSLTLCAWSESAFYSGDWTLARGLVQRAADAVRTLDRSTIKPHAQFEQGKLDLAMGDGEAAASVLAEAIRWAVASGNLGTLAACQALLAERDLLAGHPEAARQRLAPLLDPLYPQDSAVAWGLSLLAWAYRDQGELDHAETLARQTIALAAQREHRMNLVEALRVSALVALRQGRHAEAAIALNDALSRATPFPYAEAKALYVYGQMHEAAGDSEHARQSYQQALAICTRLGERLYAEHIERALAGL